MRITVVLMLAAVFYILTASHNGYAYLDAQAAYEMGLRYHTGTGGRQRNPRFAMILYCRADADGHAEAAYAIGRMYEAGQGVKRNHSLAAAWFRRAVSLGSTEAEWWAKETRRYRGRAARCPFGWGRNGVARVTPPDEIRKIVEKLAPGYGLDPKLVLAVIAVESSFMPGAVSSANAQGLMQLIPATAERFGVRDVFNPEDNIRGGMAYLKWLLRKFEGSVTLALAGYNAGEGAVQKYGGIPPYRETQNYVRKIRRLYDRREHPY